MRVHGITLPAAALAAALLASGAALADAGHGKKGYSFGEPGKAAEADRTVEVTADDRDGMRYDMDLASIRQGETIRFVVTNKGEGQHEFSVGDTASQRAHAKLMAKNPDMHHEGDPSVVVLQPGETKELVWKFSKPVQGGSIVFACQMPGHYDGGMVHKAKLEKAEKKARTS
jgi:uncharacterized cupredoxin-like copper-binding protein